MDELNEIYAGTSIVYVYPEKTWDSNILYIFFV